jgi:hypothetical protein
MPGPLSQSGPGIAILAGLRHIQRQDRFPVSGASGAAPNLQKN